MKAFRRPSPSLLVASLAIFVAAGGGAWAAGADPAAHPARSQRGPQGPRGPAGPSDGYVKRGVAPVSLDPGSDTTVVQLRLTPDRHYIVTAATELGNASGATNLVACTLLENSNPIASGSADLPADSVFSQTVTLTAATTGGNIKLSCNPNGGARARNSVVTAIKVGTVHTQ